MTTTIDQDIDSVTLALRELDAKMTFAMEHLDASKTYNENELKIINAAMHPFVFTQDTKASMEFFTDSTITLIGKILSIIFNIVAALLTAGGIYTGYKKMMGGKDGDRDGKPEDKPTIPKDASSAVTHFMNGNTIEILASGIITHLEAKHKADVLGILRELKGTMEETVEEALQKGVGFNTAGPDGWLEEIAKDAAVKEMYSAARLHAKTVYQPYIKARYAEETHGGIIDLLLDLANYAMEMIAIPASKAMSVVQAHIDIVNRYKSDYIAPLEQLSKLASDGSIDEAKKLKKQMAYFISHLDDLHHVFCGDISRTNTGTPQGCVLDVKINPASNVAGFINEIVDQSARSHGTSDLFVDTHVFKMGDFDMRNIDDPDVAKVNGAFKKAWESVEQFCQDMDTRTIGARKVTTTTQNASVRYLRVDIKDTAKHMNGELYKMIAHKRDVFEKEAPGVESTYSLKIKRDVSKKGEEALLPLSMKAHASLEFSVAFNSSGLGIPRISSFGIGFDETMRLLFDSRPDDVEILDIYRKKAKHIDKTTKLKEKIRQFDGLLRNGLSDLQSKKSELDRYLDTLAEASKREESPIVAIRLTHSLASALGQYIKYIASARKIGHQIFLATTRSH